MLSVKNTIRDLISWWRNSVVATVLCFSWMVAFLSPAWAQQETFFRFDPPHGWKEDLNLFGNDVSYSVEDQKGKTFARVTAQFGKMEQEIIRKPAGTFTAKDFDRIFMLARPKFLEKLGFGGWQIKESELSPLSKRPGYLYKVQGQYHEPGNKKMAFVEWYYYSGNYWYQFSWIQDWELFNSESLKMATHVLGRFEPKEVR